MNSLSEKQLFSLIDSDAKINIWQGAVRSGKTYISLWRFLKEVSYGPNGDYAIITRTYDTFKRNILSLLRDLIGTDAKYLAGRRELNLWGKTVHVIGSVDERAEGKIRGATLSGAYVDEASIIPNSMFTMLISRCMMGEAKIFATTNPDSPYHWLKTDYLTNNPDVKTWKFTLHDNPQLTDEERDYLKRQYKGVWYQRFIEGLWVQAQGAIYDFFDPSIHTIDFPPGFEKFSIVGVDYGTTNPFAMVMLSINPKAYPNMWIKKEFYYDSKIHQRQKTDSEYVDDLIKFIDSEPVKAIYIDPSAASFKLECMRRGVPNILDAENEVIDGIRMVSKYMSDGTLKVCRQCKNLIDEIQGYVWDASCARTGVDKPLKHADHLCDSLRYAIYTYFSKGDSTSLSPDDLDRMRREAVGEEDPFNPWSSGHQTMSYIS